MPPPAAPRRRAQDSHLLDAVLCTLHLPPLLIQTTQCLLRHLCRLSHHLHTSGGQQPPTDGMVWAGAPEGACAVRAGPNRGHLREPTSRFTTTGVWKTARGAGTLCRTRFEGPPRCL